MYDRWDEDSIVCIREHDSLKVNKSYSIKGRGDLKYNAGPNVNGKTGYGFCIEEELYNQKEKFKWYYFTIEEVCEYFIPYSEYYKILIREQKINKIINE